MHLRSGVDETRKRDLEPFFRFRLCPARDRRLLQQKSAISAFRFRGVSIEERVRSGATRPRHLVRAPIAAASAIQK
jgi:hypothetical protein